MKQQWVVLFACFVNLKYSCFSRFNLFHLRKCFVCFVAGMSLIIKKNIDINCFQRAQLNSAPPPPMFSILKFLPMLH